MMANPDHPPGSKQVPNPPDPQPSTASGTAATAEIKAEADAGDFLREKRRIEGNDPGNKIEDTSSLSTKKANANSDVGNKLPASLADLLRRLAESAISAARHGRNSPDALPQGLSQIEESDTRTQDWLKKVVTQLSGDPSTEHLFFAGLDVYAAPAMQPGAAPISGAGSAAATPTATGSITAGIDTIASDLDLFRQTDMRPAKAPKAAITARARRPFARRNTPGPAPATPTQQPTAAPGPDADHWARRDRDDTPLSPSAAPDATADDLIDDGRGDTRPDSDPEAEATDDAETRRDILTAMEKANDLLGTAGLAQLRQLIRQRGTPSNLATFESFRSRFDSDGTAGAPADAKPLSGGQEEVALQGSMVLREHPNDPVFAHQFAVGPLAATVARLETQGATAEQLVDLLIHWFAVEPVYRNGRRPPSNASFREVLNRLRAMLMQDTSGQAPAAAGSAARLVVTPGRLETYTNLATWFGMGEGDEAAACKLCAIAFGLETLPAYLQMRADPGRVGRMLAQLANNVSGWLSDELGFKRNEDIMSNTGGALLNNLHALATVAHLRQTHSGQWNEAAAALFAAVGAKADSRLNDSALDGDTSTDTHWESAARAMLFMSNIPSAWRVPGLVLLDNTVRPINPPPQIFADNNTNARFRTAVLAGMSAVVRARFNPAKDANEISSALFNLGVDMMLMRRASADIQHSTVLRMVTNALGLFWALDQGRDERQALESLNGADCAVNMMGALADAEMRDELLRDRAHLALVREIAEALLSGCRRARMQLAVARLSGSFTTIFGQDETPASVDFARRRFLPQLCTLMAVVINNRESPNPLGDLLADPLKLQTALQTDFAATCARCLKWSFDQLREGNHTRVASGFGEASAWWLDVTRTLTALSTEPDYRVFEVAGAVPTDLADWKIERAAESYDQAVDKRLLSRTLADRRLMAGFFGLDDAG